LLDVFPTFAAAAGATETCRSPLGGNLAEIARGATSRTHVISQFSQRSLGLYMVAEHDWKYIYSAPDQREWLFHLPSDPREERNLIEDDKHSADGERLRVRLLAQFGRDGYDYAVRDGRWRDYGKASFPVGARTGLLFQDPNELAPAIDQLVGYKRVPDEVSDLLGATYPQQMDPVTGKVHLPD
jgi:hypothetical protein